LSESDDKKVQLAVYIEPKQKTEIDDYIYEKRIRPFQDGYREIVKLGFIEFKKKGGKISG